MASPSGNTVRDTAHSPLTACLEARVRQLFEHEATGHDWAHIHRVRRTALALARIEGGDLELVEAGALLHDIADHKFHDGDLTVGPRRAAELVRACGGTAQFAKAVSNIVSETSFKGVGVATPVTCVESAVVQDADRLDALGPIGIARAFAYGGAKGRSLYRPGEPPRRHADFESYARDNGHTINHFYEKLFLLKDRMQTDAGKVRAEQLHLYMKDFVARFLEQWEGGM